ncbi:titin [Bicyclus anynana]|uniref:Titin n=1 Tax=Bicyclus anynana TaxID=110368 RepID=A0A6J1NRL2_BICAN|nr:titin [Bicyclus anynana]
MDQRRAAAALLALAACIACSAAAPTATNHTALELHEGPVEGCYYNFQHYGQGDRIMTNEPCLNCTCHNRMLMCYLRVCPFTKAIGQDCTVEKRADQCCPIVTCPDVPVDLLTSTSTSSPAEYGATGLGKLDKYGCSIHGKYFPEGSKVPPTPNKPCEHCYCIRNMTTCVMQECTLHVDGCTPIYHKDVCCPVRYSCDHPEDETLLLDDMTTTVRPTPGFLLTTTTISPVTQMSQDCVHDDQIFPDGALIKTEKACEHCYCMKGDIVCVVQECGTPMENKGKNCTSLPPRHGQCCPDTYICEGDERVPDSTTDIPEITSTPPRRTGVEGSGYRNEPDEPFTETTHITNEIEGSGEDFTTISYVGDIVTPEKESPGIINESTSATTETNIQLGQSTEPDKGQNTIPDSIVDKETTQEATPDKVTLSSPEYILTTSGGLTSEIDVTPQKDEVSTTESVFRVDDETISDETLTPKDHETVTTEFTDLLGKTTLADEHVSHTSPKNIELDEKATTLPTGYSNKVEEPTQHEEISTENLLSSIVTESNKFTDVLQTSTKSDIWIDSTNLVVTESTPVDPNINEVDDGNNTPISSPSRIPGEGDCLLNGITYINNTSVPSTNNCHIGCKCISSIIKCDPIICSPPPEYIENMNDCQIVYDTPNSCCPTYVCSVKETIPPESHSHMSGTNSPKPTAIECNGDDCIDSSDKLLPVLPCEGDNCKTETTKDIVDEKDTESIKSPATEGTLPAVTCEGDNCKKEIPKDAEREKDIESTKAPATQEECQSGDCKDLVVTSPSIPSQDCSDGKCEALPVIPCEGDNCKTETQKGTTTEIYTEYTQTTATEETLLEVTCQGDNCKKELPKDAESEKDIESTKAPAKQEECQSDNCKDQVVTSPSIPSQDCSDGKCEALPVIPCEGDNCKTETQKDTTPERDTEYTKTPATEETLPEVSCEGDNCKKEIPKDAEPEKDVESTKAPATQEECQSGDCKDQVVTSPSIPSQDCPDGKCEALPVIPCEGDNCKTETQKDTTPERDTEYIKAPATEETLPEVSCEGDNCKKEIQKDAEPEKDMEPTKVPATQEECQSGDCKDQVVTSPSIPSQDCPDGKCEALPVIPCEGDNCKTETQKDTTPERDTEYTKAPATEETLPEVSCEGDNCKKEIQKDAEPEKDMESTKAPATQEECQSSDCKDQVVTSPSIPSQDCSDGKCEASPVIPCEGDNCKTDTQKDITPERDTEYTKTPATEEILPEVSCEGDNCKKEIEKDAKPEKDMESTKAPATHEECQSSDCKDQVVTSPSIPSQDCSDGKCATSPVIPCEGDNCESDFVREGENIPPKCSEPDCKLPYEPTAHTEQASEVVTEATTVSDIIVQKTETIDSHIPTTTKESPENLSTTYVQIVTEPTEQHYADKESLHTNIPMSHTATETSEELVTKTDTFRTESPKLPVAITTESHSIYDHTEREQQQEEYPVIGTEESISEEKDKASTTKPHIYTDLLENTLAEDHTKSSQITVTESYTTLIDTPKLVTEQDGSKTESPKIIEKEENETKSPEIFESEKENTYSETTKASLTEIGATEATLPVTGSELPEVSVSTEKDIQQTELTETFTDREDVETPEKHVTDKEVIESETEKVTVKDIEEVQTEIPKIIKPGDDATPTESIEKLDNESQTTQSWTPEATVSTKATSEMDNEEPMVTEVIETKVTDSSVTTKQDDHLGAIDLATEKQFIEVSTPGQHEIKVEQTTTNEFDQTFVKVQPTVSVDTETDEKELDYVTKDSNPEQENITEKPESSGEQIDDKFHEPKPVQPEDQSVNDVTEIGTEHTEIYPPFEGVTEHIPTDTKTDKVTESEIDNVTYPTLQETTGDLTTKESHELTTEGGEISKTTDIQTKLTEKEVTTDKDFLYTPRPGEYETKSVDNVSHVEQYATSSPVLDTTKPDTLATQDIMLETSTLQDAVDKDKESSITDTEPTLQPTHDSTDEQEKYTKTPETYLTSHEKDEYTKLPEQYTTLAEQVATEKNTETPYVEILDTDKQVNEKDTQIHHTTLKNIEELTTTEGTKFVTVTPDKFASEPQQAFTDQKLDTETKETMTSTYSVDFVTEVSKTHSEYPMATEEIQQEIATKTPEQQISLESHKDEEEDKLTTQSTYKDEVPTDQHQTEETTKAVTDLGTSFDSIEEDERDKQTSTQYQTTQSTDERESQPTSSFTKAPEPDITTVKYPVTKERETETPYETEKESPKPLDEQPSDTTEDSISRVSYLPEHTDAIDSFTTQSASQIPLEVSTEKTLMTDETDKNMYDYKEITTSSTSDIKDRVTTEPQISFTDSEEQLPTVVSDNTESQKEQEPDNDGLLTTSSSVQPEDIKKITEVPMSLVTHIDHAQSLPTTLPDKSDITEQSSKTSVEQKLVDGETQTTLPEMYITELPKEATKSPDDVITQKQQETESSSELNTSDDKVEITTTYVMDDKHKLHQETTTVPSQQLDLSTDIPTTETLINVSIQKTEDTPSSATEEVITDSESPKITTISSPTDKEADLSHDQESTEAKPIDKTVTELPHVTQTVREDITIKTPSIMEENVNESITTSVPSEEYVTKLPEVQDMHTIPLKMDTTEDKSIERTEIPKITTEEESEVATSVYKPSVSELTERPSVVVTDNIINEKDDKATEVTIPSIDETTAYDNLEVVTESRDGYTQSKPLSDTTEAQITVSQQKESSTEVSNKATTVPDFIISTENLLTKIPEHDEQHGITDSSDKETITEDILLHSTPQIPEKSTLTIENYTEPTGTEKVTLIVEEETKPIVTVKEVEQPDIHSTEPTIEKESFTTDAISYLSSEKEKKVTGVHTPTEFTPTTIAEAQSSTQTRLSDQSEEKETTKPGNEFSETTPFLVELKEHTHQVIDESPGPSTEEIFTTAQYEVQHTERGDQNLYVTEKYDDEYHTSTPIQVTEHEHEDKLFTEDQKEVNMPIITSTVQDQEHLKDNEMPTTLSTYPETDSHDQEKQYTTIAQEVASITSEPPQILSEKEHYTTISSEEQKLASPGPETSETSTEKEVVTETPLPSEASIRTTLLDEDLSKESAKPTTSKIMEEITTPSTITEKSTQLEEKPIRTTPPTHTQELPKPGFEDEINEGILPSPDFPPSGGYGQEPDYVEEDQAFGPGTCRYGGKVYVSAQQIPRDDPCDFCFCFRSDIICLQQSCPPPIHGCHEEPIQGFCCPRYECPVSMATTLNVTTTTTTTTTTLPPHFLPHAYKGAAQRRGCQIKGHTYKVGEVVRASSGPCLHCTCGGDGQMKCDPKACTPEPMLRQMIAAAVSAKRRR